MQTTSYQSLSHSQWEYKRAFVWQKHLSFTKTRHTNLKQGDLKIKTI